MLLVCVYIYNNKYCRIVCVYIYTIFVTILQLRQNIIIGIVIMYFAIGIAADFLAQGLEFRIKLSVYCSGFGGQISVFCWTRVGV